PRRSNRRCIPNIVEPEIQTIAEIIPMADRTMKELLQAPTEGYGEAIISNLVEIVNKQVIAPAKAVEKTCVTCGGAHAYYECIATDSNPSSVCAATGSYNQVSPPNRASHQIPPPGFAPVQNNPNRFNQGQRNYFNQENNFNQGNIFRGNKFQNNQGYRAQMNNVLNFQNQAIKTIQNQINVLKGDFTKQEETLRRNLNDDMRNILSSFFQNQPSTSGTFPSNSIPNPKGEMKAVTTRSGLAYEGSSIPTESSLEKVDEEITKEILDKEHSNSLGSTAQVQHLVMPISIPEPDVSRTQSKPSISYPSRLNDQKLREKDTNQMEKFFQIFHDLHFDISFADALLLMPKFASTIKSLLANKDKLFELAKVPLNENYSAMLLKKLLEKLGYLGKFLIPCDFLEMEVCHALADLGASINLIPLSIWKKLSLPELTPTRMTLELADRSITRPKGVAEDVFVKVGKFHFLTNFIVVDFKADLRVPLILGRVDVIDVACKDFVQDILDFQYNPKSSSPTLVFDDLISESDASKVPIVKSSSPTLTPFGENPFLLPPMDLKVAEESKEKSSIEEPPELELKELPSHLEYAFLEDSNKLPVIIAKNLKVDEREALIDILMEDDYKPAVQRQRKVNPKIHDVIKKEVIKLLDAGMIYHISDSPWVSPIHCVPKKGGMTVVANENNELILTRLVTGWRVCIDYRKLNDATRKDHFPLPFMDQMLERLPRNEFYCFLDGFSGKLLKFSKLAMRDLPEAIMVPISQRRRGREKYFREMRCLRTYGVTHRLATAYHPQTSGQVEVSNCRLKRILERTVRENHTSWFDKLDDALWAFRTAYKTPIGCTPYKLVYGKSCHLLIELEHRAYWALKHVNFDLKTVGDHRKLQLNELSELRDRAYENSVIYKERTKKLHDFKIKNHIFNVGDQVLLFNSHLKIFSGKLKTRWSGPFTITRVFPYGTIELSQPNGPNFKVNGHRVKHYFGGDVPSNVALNLHTFPMAN
nr:reverse transcriptase domain-containing protein [Tanacetum cinerariifolium]